MKNHKNRRVEVYTGAYASGKSEVSINRALMLLKEEPITIVDMDTVEPAYTLRPLIKQLEGLGLNVIAQDDYFGLGEAGNVIKPEQQNCLLQKGNIVIDVGYGVGGLDILEIINNIGDEPDLQINIVLNTSKFETSSVENILEYTNWYAAEKSGWKKITGIISNPHFGDETTVEDIIAGHEIIKEAAVVMKLPIIALCVDEKFTDFRDDFEGIPVWKLKRFMPHALW